MNQPGTPQSRHRLRLLVVDDVALMRSALVYFLETAGYDVESAAGVEEALQLSQMMRWDGVIIDIDLPSGNGVELYAHILSHNGDRRLPVLFFTGRPNPILELSLHSAAWARLVPKPCGSRQFLAILEACLRAGGLVMPASGG